MLNEPFVYFFRAIVNNHRTSDVACAKLTEEADNVGFVEVVYVDHRVAKDCLRNVITQDRRGPKRLEHHPCLSQARTTDYTHCRPRLLHTGPNERNKPLSLFI